jgi:aspartyl-tRNA(Asn)/glutamyl-tRNA(Gln) amidotransferase subunit B
VAQLRAHLPELPAARRERYEQVMGLSAYDAGVLTADVQLADYFDLVVAEGAAPKSAANWVSGELSRLLNQHAADGMRAGDVALGPAGLAELIREVDDGRVSATNAKAVLGRVFASGESPRAVIEAEGLGQVSDSGVIGSEVAAVLVEFPSQVAEYRGGKQQIYGFLVGQVMKRTAGRADAKLVNEELRRQLDA